MTHTKGPWKFPNYNCFGMDRGMRVELVDDVKEEEVMGNAYLIAAAPEMLAALGILASFEFAIYSASGSQWFNTEGGLTPVPSDLAKLLIPAINNARKIIAKAKGEI